MNENLTTIYQNIMSGDQNGVTTGVQQAVDAGLAPEVILNEGMIAAMQAGLTIFRPKLLEADIQPAGTVVSGTVQGD